MEWNQTFAFKLDTGNEMLIIRLMMSSIVTGEVTIDSIELSLADIIPKLSDQK